jgi:hypothetical protein
VYAVQVSVNFLSRKMSLTNDARIDESVIKGGLRKAFHVGGNSSCRAHIRQHYELYQQRCKDGNIPENHHAVPRHIWRERNERKEGKIQVKLDGMIERGQGPKEFTRKSVLHAVTQFACNDQVSRLNPQMTLYRL